MPRRTFQAERKATVSTGLICSKNYKKMRVTEVSDKVREERGAQLSQPLQVMIKTLAFINEAIYI